MAMTESNRFFEQEGAESEAFRFLRHSNENRQALSSVFGDIAALSNHVISHYADFDVTYDIYGDLKSRYEKIAKQVERRAQT